MSLFEKAFNRIEENRFKQYNCIPFTEKFPKLSEYLPGPQQGRYYIVSGASGAGKSQVTDHMFLFTPFDFTKESETDIKVKTFYFSLELDGETKMHQWIARQLYKKYGIRASVDILQSVGKNRCSDNISMCVKETMEYFNNLEGDLIFYEGNYTAQSIIDIIESYAGSNGILKDKETIVTNSLGTQEVKVEFESYKPKDPNEYVIIIVDHASLLAVEEKSTTKLAIEKLSKYFIKAKNRYKYIPVLIQQQSAEKENVDHFKASKLEPSKDGLAESKLTYNDCDVALGIFQPQKHEINNYRGFNVLEMGDSYRNLSIFKNRFGVSNVNMGLYFDGAVNYFKELPRKDSINSSHYEMIKKRAPNW